VEAFRIISSITEIVDVFFLATVCVLGIWLYYRARGTRRVVCPLSRKWATIRLDAARSVLGEDSVAQCSRWRTGQRCHQECVMDTEHH
jgi:hypothetical protein